MKSSSAAKKQNNRDTTNKLKRCRSEMCTCLDPTHRCPIQLAHHKFTESSLYKLDYGPKMTEIPKIVKTPDHLKFERGIDAHTMYESEYTNKETKEELARSQEINKRVRDMIAKNNVEGHIRNLLLQSNKGKEHSKNKKSIGDVYYHPENLDFKKSKPRKHIPLTETSQYRVDYSPKPLSPNSKRMVIPSNKESYDWHATDSKFAAVSTYRSDYTPKSQDTQRNRELYNSIRSSRLKDDLFLPHSKPFGESEYKSNYKSIPVETTGCPVGHLPNLPPEVLSKYQHIYYDEKSNEWKTLTKA